MPPVQRVEPGGLEAKDARCTDTGRRGGGVLVS